MEAQNEEMTTDEVVRLLEVVQEFDVEAVKFTGGEPMLRQDLEEIVRRAPEGMDVSVTTNGTFLPGRAEALVDAGLERVNVSQDAMDREAFAELTQSGAYEKVLEGVQAALDAGLAPVKLNMVVFEPTAGYVPELVDHVAERDGLQPSSSSTCRRLLAAPSGPSISTASTTGSRTAPTTSKPGTCTAVDATTWGATTRRRCR